MSERAPYSRVYWAVVDDPKFASIYDDDRHLATWLRLLLIADQAHPASANVPIGTRKASLEALVSAGLIDLGSGYRYRIHGLGAERGRRSEAARTGPRRSPDGTPTGTTRDPSASLDETRRDKTRRNGAQPRATDSLRDEMKTAIESTYPDYGLTTLEAVEARKRA